MNIADQIRKKNSKDNDKTLKRIRENDPTLTELNIGNGERVFILPTVSDLSKLGAAISENTNITKFAFGIDETVKDDTNVMFINGLKQNSSINELHLRGVLFTENSIGRVGHEVLKVYQENNNLTTLRIEAQFSWGNQVIVNTIKKCTNLKVIDLSHCRITDQQLLQIVRSLEGNHVIEELNLSNLSPPRIGNDTCKELATLLKDPDCNLHTLSLEHNRMTSHYSYEGLIAIANGLVNNIKFKQLCVDRKSVDQDVEAAFSRLSFETSTSDEVGQIVFTRLSCGALSTNDTAPPAPTCWICLNGGNDKDGKSLVRECDCRGSTDGYAHISCLVGYAQRNTKVDYKSQPIIESYKHAMKFREPWSKCPLCLQFYDVEECISRQMATAFAVFVEENYEDNIPYILEALLLKLETFSRAGRHGIECIEAGSKMKSLIDQLKEGNPPPPPKGRILFGIEPAVYMNLGIIYLNADNYGESVRCFQTSLDLSKALDAQSDIAIVSGKNLATAKRRLKKKNVAIELQDKQHNAWQRVSMFILGEQLTRDRTRAGDHLRDLLNILLKTVKNGCCSDIPAGYMCGHCESSKNVIRISRAVILSICQLPLKLDDNITRKELDRLRSWVYNQVQEFKDDSGGDIKAVLPEKLSKLILGVRGTESKSKPPWEEDDFGILLQQPSPSWIVRINVLMLMGYKVVLVNFNDVARFSRKDLKVVHDDISRLLCPADNGDDKVNELNEAMNKRCNIKNSDEGSEQVQAVDDGSSPSGSPVASPQSRAAIPPKRKASQGPDQPEVGDDEGSEQVDDWHELENLFDESTILEKGIPSTGFNNNDITNEVSEETGQKDDTPTVYSRRDLEDLAKIMRQAWIKSPSSKEELLKSMDKCLGTPDDAARVIILNSLSYIADHLKQNKNVNFGNIIDMFEVLHIERKILNCDIEAAMSDFLEFIGKGRLPNYRRYFDVYGKLFSLFANRMQALSVEWLVNSTRRIIGDKWNRNAWNVESCKRSIIWDSMWRLAKTRGILPREYSYLYRKEKLMMEIVFNRYEVLEFEEKLEKPTVNKKHAQVNKKQAQDGDSDGDSNSDSDDEYYLSKILNKSSGA